MLLDSHVVLWLVADPDRIGRRAHDLVGRGPSVFVSAISHAEFVIKAMLGKLSVPADFADLLQKQGLTELPFTPQHAARIAEFPDLVGHDPFDRMLLAQAAHDGMRFLTADRRLVAMDIPFVVDASR